MLIDARERGPFTCPFITGYIRAPLPLINRGGICAAVCATAGKVSLCTRSLYFLPPSAPLTQPSLVPPSRFGGTVTYPIAMPPAPL